MNTTTPAARIAQVEAELARIADIRQRDAEARARFAQMSTAEIWCAVYELEAAAAAGRAVQLERHRAARPAPRVEPVAAEPREALAGQVAGAPVYALCGYDAAEQLGQRSTCYALRVELAGLTLVVDHGGFDLAERDDTNTALTWQELGALIELHTSGALAELAALARRYVRGA